MSICEIKTAKIVNIIVFSGEKSSSTEEASTKAIKPKPITENSPINGEKKMPLINAVIVITIAADLAPCLINVVTTGIGQTINTNKLKNGR